MKKNFLFTILMLGLVLLVYFNIEDISDFINDLSKDKVIIPESNEYKRNYKYIRFSNDEEYYPLSKEDIKNIYYNVLNNGWDTFTFYCPDSYVECTDDILEIGDDKQLLSKINNYVHPFNSFLHIYVKIVGNKVTIQNEKKYSDEMIETINNKVDEVLNSLNIGFHSDRTKIEQIHNYIINNSTYDEDYVLGTSSHKSNSAYGNLIEGFGVCSGYSDAMAIFLDRLNIPNIKVSSENHIWNLVYVDGEWLHLDLTWDDTENVRYNNNYFLITKERLFVLDDKEHNFDEDFFLEA